MRLETAIQGFLLYIKHKFFFFNAGSTNFKGFVKLLKSPNFVKIYVLFLFVSSMCNKFYKIHQAYFNRLNANLRIHFFKYPVV